ncbi:MAG: hypothetical protein RLZZ165_1759 [Bacteroidota bacterium]|jgi:hypothetical protein
MEDLCVIPEVPFGVLSTQEIQGKSSVQDLDGES